MQGKHFLQHSATGQVKELQRTGGSGRHAILRGTSVRLAGLAQLLASFSMYAASMMQSTPDHPSDLSGQDQVPAGFVQVQSAGSYQKHFLYDKPFTTGPVLQVLFTRSPAPQVLYYKSCTTLSSCALSQNTLWSRLPCKGGRCRAAGLHAA